MSVAGLLLAAGAGRRFGAPKALVRVGDEPMVCRALETLRLGGCSPVCVVLGARAEQVRAVLPDYAHTVYAPDWADGMGSSLRAGLRWLDSLASPPEAALVHLVDLPDVPAAAVTRIRELAAPRVVARACYDGVPGHPVLLGSQWWAEIATSVTGDRGARDWLRSRGDLAVIECRDLATGADVDEPADLEGPSA